MHTLAERFKKGDGQLLVEFPAMPGRHYRIDHEADVQSFIDYTIYQVSTSCGGTGCIVFRCRILYREILERTYLQDLAPTLYLAISDWKIYRLVNLGNVHAWKIPLLPPLKI